MTARAKLFQNGGSQAVRLPKSCRFPDDQTEVIVQRVGRKIILTPVDEWSDDFRECLGAWEADIARPLQRKISDLEDPFE